MPASGAGFAQALAQWLVGQAWTASASVLQAAVFSALRWSDATTALVDLSRQLFWSSLAVFLGWALLGSMGPWTAIKHGPSPGQVLVRTVGAGLVAVAAAPVTQWMLALNNAVVAAVVGSAGSWPAGQAVSLGTLLAAPLLAMTLVLLGFGLSLYLGLFYAWRALEVAVLTAVLPWLALYGLGGGDDGAFRRGAADLVAAVFIQSLHAGAFWLAARLIAQGGSLGSELEAVGVLWFMTRLPGQLRRWLGQGRGAGFGV
ncbi:MAG: hypothetical protein K6U14_09745 [Firmicutes bacterium]|nr:hypothetical protein [Alicyclobacillaceae bacterium]MCL6497895.1 hypothetical protein [Bacillota bacterium]